MNYRSQMWPPIYQSFESHSCLYTEFTGAREEKCMLNSCSVNTVQGIQGTGPTSLRSRNAYIHLLTASNTLQDIATGLYRTDISVYSQKEYLAMYNPPLPSSMLWPFSPQQARPDSVPVRSSEDYKVSLVVSQACEDSTILTNRLEPSVTSVSQSQVFLIFTKSLKFLPSEKWGNTVKQEVIFPDT